MKTFLKDLLSGALFWTEIFAFLRWYFFQSYLDDEISPVVER